jgi:hypothetical protein
MKLVAEAMLLWHPRLHKAEVQIGVLMADNEESAPLKVHGHAALACIKIVSLADRVSKRYEAEIKIDAQNWSDMEEPGKMALLDHELCHINTIDLSKEKLQYALAKGRPLWKTDSLDRPRLVSVKGDWASSDGFKQVCARHGKLAWELKSISECLAVAEAARATGWHPPVDEPYALKEKS